MNNFIEKFQQSIEQELLRILLLLRIGSIVGLVLGFYFTPWPWNLVIFSPILLGPTLAYLSRFLPPWWSAPDQRAQEAERRRIWQGRQQSLPAPFGPYPSDSGPTYTAPGRIS